MNEVGAILAAAIGANPLEIVAVMLGLANVGLLVRRSIWNYPFGLAMVSIYAVIFFEQKLYSDAGLQVFFFAIQIYGWVQWAKSRDTQGRVIVQALTPPAALAYAAAALGGALALGSFMAAKTDAAFPFWDSTIAALSIVAQVMLARRLIENWFVWIAVDILAIGLFSVKGLYPTTGLYLVFLMMSVAGFVAWRRAKSS